MIPEEITKDLRTGMSLDECLKKHNTNLKQLFSGNITGVQKINDEVLGGYIYHSGVCSDCKRCYDMSFYHSWKGCCMIWQSLEHPEQMAGGVNG